MWQKNLSVIPIGNKRIMSKRKNVHEISEWYNIGYNMESNKAIIWKAIKLQTH